MNTIDVKKNVKTYNSNVHYVGNLKGFSACADLLHMPNVSGLIGEKTIFQGY